jgi:ABC-type transporter Mla MlaB component
VEAGSSASASVEEAAILFASGHTQEAIAALTHLLLDNPESREFEPWLMLFDLYRLTGERQAFEELGLEFAVKFERSPPPWVDAQGPEQAPARTHKPRPANYFAFTGELSEDTSSQLDRLAVLATQAQSVSLDFGKVQRIAPAAALLMHDALSDLKTRGVAIRHAGSEHLLELLAEARQAAPSETCFWLLTLDLLQLLGRQAEFEDLAVNYAVQFEVSPPSWEPVKSRVEKAGEEGLPALSTPPANGFALRGVISTHSQDQLQALRDYAADRTSVEIDMSAVERVDFASVGLLMNLLIELSQGGRRVLIRDANEPTNTLMRTMGIDQLVTVIGRTR